MPFLFKPIATRMFLFMYILGMASSIITAPDISHMYDNTKWELFIDVYLLSAVVCLIPQRHIYNKVSVTFRDIVKAIIYCIVYPMYIIDTFCLVKFGTTINPSMILLLDETNGNEASEFFSTYVTPDILLTDVGTILLIMLLHIAVAVLWHYKPRHWHHKPGCIGRMITNGVLTVLLIYSVVTSYDNKQMFMETMHRDTVGEIEHDMSCKPHTELYQPWMRVLFSFRSNQLASEQLTRLESNVGRVKVDSCSVKSPNIVLIIGESSNKRHFQLYGYDIENNPNQVRMEQEGNLIKMEDVVSPWNLTSFVFKHLMTTYCVGDANDWCDYPLFCEIFRKAGYHVTFLTNQWETKAKQAVYDFSGGFFINNDKLSKAQFDQRNTSLHIFDEGLLDDYEKTLPPKGQETKADSMPRLTIFHLMGEHVNYRVRCPNAKKKFWASTYEDQQDLNPRERKMMADYDNAVWYNDSVVNQIVERFKDQDAIIIYFSDHGEEVFGPGARHSFGRMHKTDITKRLADEEFRIPMWFYVTEKYKALHPDVVKSIEAVRYKKYMTDAMSHLLLGLAGIHCPYYRPQYDLLSPQYNENRKRILKHTTDYDTLK